MAVGEDLFKKHCATSLVVPAPIELSFLTASLCIFFTLTSIPGNLLIILAVVLNPNRNLRTPFNWLVVNLAVADLLVGLFTDPTMVVIHVKEGVGKKLSQADRYSAHMSYFIACSASVLSITTLAVERYLAVRKPNIYNSSVTSKRIVLTIVGTWLLSLSLPNVYFEVDYVSYSFIFANTCVAIASIITCLTCIMVLKTMRKRTKNMVKRALPANRRTDFAFPTPALVVSAHETEMKVTKMFSVILLAMLCCYVPSTLCSYLLNFCKSCGCTSLHWFRDFHFVFVLMNSSVNFFPYALQSRKFRSAFMKIIKRTQNSVENETSLGVQHFTST
ncbi:adenosine receptor A2a-like [Xenia sp. Carnegie-2017]|uniref:adenosine receptor A2a-like n=1 Tax=Xenia sp. Carnegie-2017 TaxID=2897299 RepID=UPI001F04354F|nr:adenosine receptor A2a-like [Xenia sp. Carnegie-2017]